MLRPTTPADTRVLVNMTEDTGVFKPIEIEALQEVLDDYHAINHNYGHLAYSWINPHTQVPLGFVYYAPTAMTDRTWELWWIVVDKWQQGRGIGKEILEWVEADVTKQSGRLLLIETSSTPAYVPTRHFYLNAGYTISAEVTDFYSDGDSKVIYAKRMDAFKNQVV